MMHSAAHIVPGQLWYSTTGSGDHVRVTKVDNSGVAYEWYMQGKLLTGSYDIVSFQMQYFNPLLVGKGSDTINVLQRRSVWEK